MHQQEAGKTVKDIARFIFDIKFQIRSNELFNRIKDFMVNQSVIEENNITEDSLLETDLGIHWADAMEYIVAFGKQFNVNVSKFMAADYFSAEGGLKLLPWMAKLFDLKE